MKEFNRERLRAALDRLPTYQPPTEAWSAIQSGMHVSDGPVELPEYSPPSHVWNTINQKLDQTKSRQTNVRQMRQWLGRAAAVLLLFTVGYWSANYDAGPAVAVQESVEQAPIRPAFTALSEDEKSFEEMLRELEERNEPTLNQLRYELEELTFAKRDVEAMLVSYGQDAMVINKLADIERERSAVYRQIIAVR